MTAVADTIAALDGAHGVLAGGTILLANGGPRGQRRDLVDISFLDELRIIEWADDELRLGALVRIEELVTNPDIVTRFPALGDAASRIASPAVRSIATVGGNLFQPPRCSCLRPAPGLCAVPGGSRCSAARPGPGQQRGQECLAWYSSSLATVFVLHGGSLEFADGSQRSIADGCCLQSTISEAVPATPQNLLTRVRLRRPPARLRSAYVRVTARRDLGWPIVEAAVASHVGPAEASARVVAGFIADRPVRLPALEAALLAHGTDQHLPARLAALLDELSLPLPLAGVKARMLGHAVASAWHRVTGPPHGNALPKASGREQA